MSSNMTRKDDSAEMQRLRPRRYARVKGSAQDHAIKLAAVTAPIAKLNSHPLNASASAALKAEDQAHP